MDNIIDNFMDNGDFGQKVVGKYNTKRQICQQKLKKVPYMHFFRFFVGSIEKNDQICPQN